MVEVSAWLWEPAYPLGAELLAWGYPSKTGWAVELAYPSAVGQVELAYPSAIGQVVLGYPLVVGRTALVYPLAVG